MTSILDRIAAAAGVAGLAEILGEKLSSADLTSLLLEVFRRRSGRRTPSQVLAEYERGRLFGGRPMADLLEIRQQVAACCAEFTLLEFSPITPLATTSSVAPISPDRSVAALHSAEVVSDPTNVLALEAAIRRKAALALGHSGDAVDLGTVHRVVRPQRYADPKAFNHFTLLGLVSAGRDRGGFAYEAEALARHANAHLRLIAACLPGSAPPRLTYSAAEGIAPTDPRVVALRDAAERYGGSFDEERGRDTETYYKGVCFHILGGSDGKVQLSDGGFVDWTAKFLSNAKERLLISGMGLEFLPALRGK